jgi:predicted esterase
VSQSRRSFLAGLAPLVVPRLWWPTAGRGPGRLASRPGTPSGVARPGRTALGVAQPRDSYLYIPSGYDPTSAAGLVVMLHGATQDAEFSLRIMSAAADAHGFVLLAPNSSGTTWDAIGGRFGPDVGVIDRALTQTFTRCRIDPARIVAAGFSDGASYALSLGLINGDLFPRVMAFSPGFVVEGEERHGRPKVFVSHGTRDHILPIDRTSRVVVPWLRRQGYQVEYYEFEGPHRVQDDALAHAMSWLAS